MSKRILSLGFLMGLFWSTVAVVAQEQASKPTFKEGDTWQFNITRKAGSSYVSSTDFNEGMYELMVSQGNVKLYTLEGGKKEELVINEEGPTQALLTQLPHSSDQNSLFMQGYDIFQSLCCSASCQVLIGFMTSSGILSVS